MIIKAFIIFVLLVILILFMIFYIMTNEQNKKSQFILEKLTGLKLNHLRIKFIQYNSKGYAAGGLTIKANVYFDNDILLISPKKNSLFSGILYKDLPIVFSSNIESTKERISYKTVFIPQRFSFQDDKYLEIIYEIGRIHISCFDKKDYQVLKLIRDANYYIV